MYRVITFSLFLLLSGSLYAQLFSPKQTINHSVSNPEVIKTADFNNDGYADVVYSAVTDPKIAVSLYNPSAESFDSEIVVSTDFPFAVSLFPADLDGDGAVDFLTVSQLDNKVAWFRNNGSGNFSLQTLISDSAVNPSAVIAVDVDLDNDLDVVSASKGDNKIVWYENDGSGNFSPAFEITANAEICLTLTAADINNDTYPDIIAGYALTDKIVSFFNNQDGTFGTENLITDQTDYIRSLATADLNQDGNIDIISISKSDHKLAWYDNRYGTGVFSGQKIISGDIDQGFDLAVADFNLDTHPDLVCTALAGNEILVFNNADGLGNFAAPITISDTCIAPKGITTGDFDHDGDIDIAACHSDQNPDEVVWYENGESGFLVHSIHQIREVSSIDVFDINNDGNTDIFYSDAQNVCWVENQNGGASFGSENILYQGGFNITDIELVDIDNDGDKDLFVADAQGDQVFWFKNLDGNGNFGTQTVIDYVGDGPVALNFADVDGDNDLDLMVDLHNEAKIALYENTDGMGAFSKTIIGDIAIVSVAFIDIDHDNDEDIIYSEYDHTGCMLNDGAGNYGTPFTLNDDSYSWSMHVTDLNDDDYDDVVYAPDYDLHYLINNQDNTFLNQNIDFMTSVDHLTTGDLDADGNPEILSTCRILGYVYYAINMDNSGNFDAGLPILIKDVKEVKVCDINNDGYKDVVAGAVYPSHSLNWAENYQFRIINHPADYGACIGGDAYFSIVSSGVKTYQWQIDTGTGFTDLTDNATYSGTDKAQLTISNVNAGMFGNLFRCQVYDRNGMLLTSQTAMLSEYQPSILCLPNQTRTADSTNTYTVVGDEFDPDRIFNRCNEDLSIENDYNFSGTLDAEVMSPGLYTIQWTLKDSDGYVLDSCAFDVLIQENLGVGEEPGEEISIFPNPALDLVNIRCNFDKVEIYNRLGQKILTEAGKNVIDISPLAAGIYFVRIEYRQGNNSVRKLIKR